MTSDERLRAFIADTLALWGIDGAVESTAPPAAAMVRTREGTIIWIERPASAPFPWQVRSRGAGETPGGARERRARACTSLIGVLNALRSALGVERGSAARVVPAPLPDRDPPAIDATAAALHAGSKAALARAGLPERTPVSVLTGFLGSGKTTLLARLLRDPSMSRTAVIINEFGEIALDHDLVEASDESFVQLSTGCLCCRVRSDLVLTLADLAARRAAGALPPFERVVIETSGLADPAPILHALMTDRDLAEVYALEGVVTTVDALMGLDTLAHQGESLRQAALADRVVFTKTDLAGGIPPELRERIARINPGAPALTAVRGAIAPATLFECASTGEAAAQRLLASLAPAPTDATTEHAHEHTPDIATFSIVREHPVHAATLALFISALAENCGADLLRMKGIVNVAEAPERPAVIHGVQHVYHAPEWLERWTSEDRRTRMVFIGTRVHEAWTHGLLELLDGEVADEGARRAREGERIERV
jgi:G3E family GTPase